MSRYVAICGHLDRKNFFGCDPALLAKPLPDHSLGIPSGEDAYCRSYVNFYIANRAIIAPAYGIDEDLTVFDTLTRAYPDRTIVQIPLGALFRGGGGIHCITQQEPAGMSHAK